MSDATSSTASYWCEYAWLGGAEVVAGVVVDVAAGHPESGDGGQVVGVRHGMAPPPSCGTGTAECRSRT